MTAQPQHQRTDDRLPADRVDCHAGRRWADADDRRHGYQHDQLDPDTGRPWRLLKSHQPDCEDPACGGCTICPERHCQVCGWRHVTVDGRGSDLTCSPCLAETRTAIADLWDRASELFVEALYRGTNATAAGLAGPIANIEAWTYRRLSAIANRIPAGWLDEQRDDQHPLWVLGTWEREARHQLGQVLSPGSAQPTLTEARDYLDRHLHRLAHADGFAFDELASDVARCLDHLHRVLRSDDHADVGAPCPKCGSEELRKVWDDAVPTGEYHCTVCRTPALDPAAEHCANLWCWTSAPPTPVLASSEAEDRWTCRRCQAWWTEHDYRAKVTGTYVHVARVLTGSQIREVYRVPEGTVRSWAERGKVRKHGRDQHGRMLYDVDDVKAARDEQQQRDRERRASRETRAAARTAPASAR